MWHMAVLDFPTKDSKILAMHDDGGQRVATLWIYDYIDSWGDPWGVSLKDVKAELDDAETEGPISRIHLRINSEGGDVFEGFAIYSYLFQHEAKVTGQIDGVALSSASVVAMAADELTISEAGMMMIHRPWTITLGTEDEHEKSLELLRKIAPIIIRTYRRRANLSEEELVAALRAETWYTAEEAVEAGLADTIVEAVPVAAAARHHPQLPLRNVPPEARAFLARYKSLTDDESPLAAEIAKIRSELDALIKDRSDSRPAKPPQISNAAVRERLAAIQDLLKTEEMGA